MPSDDNFGPEGVFELEEKKIWLGMCDRTNDTSLGDVDVWPL